MSWAASHWTKLQDRVGWAQPLDAMPAHRVLALAYHDITDGLDDDGVLRIDALLGDPIAKATLDRREQAERRQAVASMGIEVG
jgi:hypothetical protein